MATLGLRLLGSSPSTFHVCDVTVISATVMVPTALARAALAAVLAAVLVPQDKILVLVL